MSGLAGLGVLTNTFLVSALTSRYSETSILTGSLTVLVFVFALYSQVAGLVMLLAVIAILSAVSSVMYTVLSSTMTKVLALLWVRAFPFRSHYLY